MEHAQWRAFERRSLAWFDAHAAVSEHDAGYFRRYAGGVPVSVVPNGVDTAAIQPRPDPQGPPTLLYIGSMDYPPNADAVLDFAQRTLAPDPPCSAGRPPAGGWTQSPPEVQRLAADLGSWSPVRCPMCALTMNRRISW